MIKRILLIFIFLGLSTTFAQTFKPAMQGIASGQNESSGFFDIQFKTDGPMGRDWIYGSYLDEDSLTRCVAYREGGRWIPLPFSGYYGNEATDIEMYGDTLYIAGDFSDVVQDNKTDTLPNTGILKYYNDSVWVGDTKIKAPRRLAAKGDSLIIAGASYQNLGQQLIYGYFMTPDKGATWQYPFTVKHPTNSNQNPSFGPGVEVEFLSDGDIVTTNHNSPIGNPYLGIVRWDGNKWHSYGNSGLHGGLSGTTVEDFLFYKGNLHIGGTFAQTVTYFGDTIFIEPRNPGDGIARWNGMQWENVGGGILEGGVRDMFLHNDILYCRISGGHHDFHLLGDAHIPYFAGWDGTQWCGTPIDSDTGDPWSWGIVNDTLFMVVKFVLFDNPKVDGHPVTYMNYFDGDYLHGPNAICSTPGLGEGENTLAKEAIEVYPNPASDVLYVSLPAKSREATYQLLALDGRQMQNGTLQPGENTLEIADKLSGVFLLKIETVNGVLVKKVVIEK